MKPVMQPSTIANCGVKTKPSGLKHIKPKEESVTSSVSNLNSDKGIQMGEMSTGLIDRFG
jgi:hypothetical protein